MKFFFALIATLFFALPAWAVDVQMGYNGGLVFEPSEVTIAAGDSIHFVNNVLPPHNVPSSAIQVWHFLLENPLTFPLMFLVSIPFGVILIKGLE